MCKRSDVLSVGDRGQKDNYSAVIFDSTWQYVTENMFLVLKKMVFPCLSLLRIYPTVKQRSAITHLPWGEVVEHMKSEKLSSRLMA